MGNICCSEHRKIEDTNILEIESKKISLKSAFIKNLDSKKIIKILHNNDTTVFLLEDNIVLKKFDMSSQSTKFNNEIETYKRLKSLPFILKPILITNDSIYLPYISKKPQKTTHNKKIVDTYLEILKRDYGISRISEYQWCNLLQCPKTQQIYLISFGNIPWISYLSNTKWVISDNLPYKSILSTSK